MAAAAAAAARLPRRFVEFLRVNGVEERWYEAQVAAARAVPRHVWLSRASAARWTQQRREDGAEGGLEDADALCRRLRTSCEEFIEAVPGAERVQWAGRWDREEQVWALPPEMLISKHPLYIAGVFMGIDAASVLAVDALDVHEGQAALDICCAPGAKLSVIADRLGHKGTLVGVDACPERISACVGVARRRRLGAGWDKEVHDWFFQLRCQDGTAPIGGAGRIVWDNAMDAILFGGDSRDTQVKLVLGEGEIVRLAKPRRRFTQRPRELVASLREGQELPSQYDRVLVDAQCSHEGSVRHILKHLAPSRTEAAAGVWSAAALDGLYETWLREADELEALQRRLILNGFDALRPGGRLVYSTCSFATAQNEAIVEHLLAERPNARVVASDLHPSAPMRESGRLAHALIFDPLASGTSGLFLSAIVKDAVPPHAQANCPER